MCRIWPIGQLGTLPKMDMEFCVGRQSPLLCVHIQLEQMRSLLGQFRIELVIPGQVEGVGHVQPLPVQTQLNWPQIGSQNYDAQNLKHLRAPLWAGAILENNPFRLFLQLLVLQNFHSRLFANASPNEALAHLAHVEGVGNVELANIAMQPVGEVEEL